MDNTQLDVLLKVNKIYREIASLTNRISALKPSDHIAVLEQRGILIKECENALLTLESLPVGGTLSLIEEQKEILHDNIVGVVTQDKINSDLLNREKDHVEKRINSTVGTRRVSQAYELHSRGKI